MIATSLHKPHFVCQGAYSQQRLDLMERHANVQRIFDGTVRVTFLTEDDWLSYVREGDRTCGGARHAEVVG